MHKSVSTAFARFGRRWGDFARAWAAAGGCGRRRAGGQRAIEKQEPHSNVGKNILPYKGSFGIVALCCLGILNQIISSKPMEDVGCNSDATIGPVAPQTVEPDASSWGRKAHHLRPCANIV